MREKERKPNYMPLRYDHVFKVFFGREDHKVLLNSMLNNYLDMEINLNEDTKLINTDSEKYLDGIPHQTLRVETSGGELINVEIQAQEEFNILYRLNFHNSKMYADQPINTIGDNLKPNISLAFTMFDIFESESYRNHIGFYNESSKEMLSTNRSVIVIELSKYKKEKGNKEMEKKEMERDLWAEFLLARTDEEFEELEKTGGIIAEAVRKLRIFTEEEGLIYWPMIVEKLEMEMISNREIYEQRGIEIGKEQGIAIGKEQGMKEAQRKITLNMLKLGLDLKIISQSTGLALDEINKLK